MVISLYEHVQWFLKMGENFQRKHLKGYMMCNKLAEMNGLHFTKLAIRAVAFHTYMAIH